MAFAMYGSVPVDFQKDIENDERRKLSKLFNRRLVIYVISGVMISCCLVWQFENLQNSFFLLQSITVSTAPSLPLGWEVRYTTRGVPFYYDAINDVTSFTPPSPAPYPTVLNSPIFSQPYPSLFPPTTLVSNYPLHKWGQFGVGPVPYTPFGPYQSQVALFSVKVERLS